MFRELRPALLALVTFTIITGVAYPALMTGVAAVAFPRQANGSLLVQGDSVIGSSLIGQPFHAPKYFWGRRSATTPEYNAASSSGSNLGPLSPVLDSIVKARTAELRAADPGNTAPIPADLLTASASGLDPDITPAAAEYQAPRVARVRGLPVDRVRRLVAAHTEGRTFGFLGEPRVNVLSLNLSLDSLEHAR